MTTKEHQLENSVSIRLFRDVDTKYRRIIQALRSVAGTREDITVVYAEVRDP